MTRRAPLLRASLAALLLAGCGGSRAHVRPHAPWVPASPPAPDSAAVGVWHLDENGGTRVGDAGPFRLDGTAGIDTRTDFGRFRSARVFERATDSFLLVPYDPVMDVRGSFTVEAWINLAASPINLQVIAARWTPVPNEQSWVLGVSGAAVETAWFPLLTAGAPAQRLLFGFVPAHAGSERGYVSNTALPLGHWVHVAASVDGELVRLYVDGRLDAQYVNTNTIRPSPAPLVVGNAIDPRRLTSFGGDLRLDAGVGSPVAYPFIGLIDEVRLSSSARTRFEGTAGR